MVILQFVLLISRGAFGDGETGAIGQNKAAVVDGHMAGNGRAF